MTRRGAALLLALMPLVALAARFRPLLPVVLAVLGIIVVAGVVDSRLAPGRARLRVRREHELVLRLGRPNTIALHIEVDGVASSRVFRALVRDEHPSDIDADVEVQHATFGAGRPAILRYTLTPRARGERAFGRVVMRVTGPLGLAWRQTALAAGDATVRVDPDLSAIAEYEALARRGQLVELGVRALRRRGEGTEFERIRDAVPDDPLRSINWKATARTGRLMAVDLIPERAQPVILCIDHGRLMGVGAGALTKLDHAIGAALLLAHVALRTGDRVGLFVFSDGVTATVPPRTGRMQMRLLLEALRPVMPTSIESDYDEALVHLSRSQRRRALLVIFTDVLDPDQGASLIAQTARLRRRHLPLVVTVRDPALDAAAGRRPADVSETYARSVAAGLLADRADVISTLRRNGVETVDADARSVSPRLLNRYLDLKRRARI